MGRTRRSNTFRVGIESLERRDNPSSFGGPPLANAQPSPIMPRTDFHRSYINILTIREFTATQAAARLSQAFQLFEQNALGIPVKISGLGQNGTGTNPGQSATFRQLDNGPIVPLVDTPAGQVPYPATYENFFAQLTAYTDSALDSYVERTYRLNPSIRAAPNFSPRARSILVPYANALIAQAEQSFLANPPVFDPTSGALVDPAPKQAVESAFNAILYAVGEYTVHPNLFTRSTDFYVDPSFTFKIPYLGNPASEIPNVYGRGPGGVALPGRQRR